MTGELLAKGLLLLQEPKWFAEESMGLKARFAALPPPFPRPGMPGWWEEARTWREFVLLGVTALEEATKKGDRADQLRACREHDPARYALLMDAFFPERGRAISRTAGKPKAGRYQAAV